MDHPDELGARLDWSGVLDALCEPVLGVEKDGSIVFSNRAAREVWGYEVEELGRLGLSGLFVEGREQSCAQGILQEVEQTGQCQGDFLFLRKDGGRFLGALRACLVQGMVRRDSGLVILSVRDLTEQRRLQQKFLESQKLSYLERVVDGLAHEIRNPIVTLGGYARRLQKMLEPEHPGQIPLRIMLSDVERLESMLREVEDYLDFARSHRLSFRKVDLKSVLKEALALVPLHEDVRVEESYSEEGPWIFGDPIHLRELFRHLLDNAAEAMPQGGLIRIAVSQQGPTARVRIEDTGVGIPEKFLHHIFSPFFTTKTKGAGVGLAKAHMIVDEHGGQIEVHSEVARGTTFDVIFPLDRRQTPRRVV